MSASIVKVGNAQGFWGDQPSAPKRLLEQQPDLDFLTLDYLAEVSLSIMAIQKDKNPLHGYARDFVSVLKSLAPLWKQGHPVRIITNAGGLNPQGCAQECAKVLLAAGCEHLKLGIVSGDAVFSQLLQGDYPHLDTGASLSGIKENLVSANAYIGASSIVDALDRGANIVIAGRVADPSLTVGACAHFHRWNLDAYDLIAGATVAGHLIECGTQVTGGVCTHWSSLDDAVDIAYPIVEVSVDGSCTVTKPNHTGGAVTVETVKEQILYELGDPANYLSPDATVSFMGVHVEEESTNRIRVQGAQGCAPPDSYKVSATYRDGFRAEAMLTVIGAHALKKARLAGNTLLQRLDQQGKKPARHCIECLGSCDGTRGILSPPPTLYETVLRIAVADPKKETVDAFSKEIASLVTSGPQGVTGYASGRPKVRPVFGYWPVLIPRSAVSPQVEILEVSSI